MPGLMPENQGGTDTCEERWQDSHIGDGTLSGQPGARRSGFSSDRRAPMQASGPASEAQLPIRPTDMPSTARPQN